jgi:hypothetical protein
MIRIIKEYTLVEGLTETHNELCITGEAKLLLPAGSYVLSVLAERSNSQFSIKAYISEWEEAEDDDKETKVIALVATHVPDGDGLGWRFINSLVVPTGPEKSPKNTPYHAYVKIC